MKSGVSLKNVAKGAGTVILCLVAFDLVASLITIVVGAEILKK